MIKIEVDGIILGCAFRYALNRQSYIYSYIIEEYNEHMKELSDTILFNAYREIEEDMSDNLPNYIKQAWCELHNKIGQELDSRNYSWPGYIKPQ